MQPVVCKLTAVCALGLGDLVLVVREDQVLAARVDVDRLAEVLVDHRGALDVPARTSGAPRRLPARLARLCALPDRKVHRIFLDLADADACARLQLIQRLVGQLAVLGGLLRAEVDVAVVHRIRIALVDQGLDDVDDRIHGLGRAWMNGGRTDAQTLCVGEVFLDVAVGDDVVGHALLVCLFDDLIVDVGEVLYELDLIAAVLKVAAQRVEDDKRTRVADVEVVVDRRTAGVHLDLALFERDELLLGTGHRIV